MPDNLIVVYFTLFPLVNFEGPPQGEADPGRSLVLMKARLVYALSAALAVYCLLAATSGTSGFRAAREARVLVDRMNANMVELETRNRELRAKVDWMETDPEALRLAARDSGLLERGALLIRLPADAERGDACSTGALVPWEPSGGMADSDLKLTGLVLGLAVFFVSLLVPDGGARRRARNRAPDGAGFKLEGRPA